MILGYLYTKGLIKNGSALFRLWCWLANQRWYQVSLIPMHVVQGYYYKYTTKQIYYFCKGIVCNRVYEQQYKKEHKHLFHEIDQNRNALPKINKTLPRR